MELHAALTLLFICTSILIFNNKDQIKNGYIVINNILLIIKKRTGGKYATLLGDFAHFDGILMENRK